MQLVEGGMVRIPLRYIYLCVIVLPVAYFVAREMALAPRRRVDGVCQRVLEDISKISEQDATSRRSHPKNLFNPNFKDDALKPASVLEQVVGSAGEACWMRPQWMDPSFCADCYRTRAKTLSKLLQPVKTSLLRFPRAPKETYRLRETKQQSFIEDYLITPNMVCRSDRRCPYLIAIQLSTSDDFERRRAIRTTWGSVAKTKVWPMAEVNAEVQILFVIGRQKAKLRKAQDGKKSESVHTIEQRRWEKLQQEAKVHGDILYLDMHDSYFNLTLKLLSAFRWVHTHCTSIQFVLKVDTDTFVNIPMLIDLLILNEERLKYAVIGHMYTEDRVVHRNKRWAVNSTAYPPPTYPVYASGCAYVLSKLALQGVVLTFPYIPSIHIEDAFVTGILARLLGLKHFETPPGTFAHMDETNWSIESILTDVRITGTSVNNPRMHKALWSLFLDRTVLDRDKDQSKPELRIDKTVRSRVTLNNLVNIDNLSVNCYKK